MPPLRIAFTLSCLVCVVCPVFAQDQPNYSVLAADKGHVALVNAKGEVEWAVPTKAEVHDLALLPNGNLLYPTGPTTVVEITRAGKEVWRVRGQTQGRLQGPDRDSRLSTPRRWQHHGRRVG